MINKALTSLAFAAGCTIALAVPAAQAQTVDTRMNAPRINGGDRAGSLAGRNNAESAQYDRLLEMSPEFRQGRMLRECGPLKDLQLRASCEDSFSASQDERDLLGSQEGLTGGSTGTMNPLGPSPDSPNVPIPDAGR